MKKFINYNYYVVINMETDHKPVKLTYKNEILTGHEYKPRNLENIKGAVVFNPGFGGAIGNYVLTLTSSACAPPANDLCADAITIACGDAVAGSTTFAILKSGLHSSFCRLRSALTSGSL